MYQDGLPFAFCVFLSCCADRGMTVMNRQQAQSIFFNKRGAAMARQSTRRAGKSQAELVPTAVVPMSDADISMVVRVESE